MVSIVLTSAFSTSVIFPLFIAIADRFIASPLPKWAVPPSNKIFLELDFAGVSWPIKKPDEDDIKYNERVSRWQQLTNDNYNKAEIIIAKQRHGPIGSIKMHFDANYTKFSDLTTKDYDTIIEWLIIQVF